MDERAEKARITAPIGAHAPRSPAPINATRPDFPVRAGQLFLLGNFRFSASDLRLNLQARPSPGFKNTVFCPNRRPEKPRKC
jgi:hypothetical protein